MNVQLTLEYAQMVIVITLWVAINVHVLKVLRVNLIYKIVQFFFNTTFLGFKPNDKKTSCEGG